MPLGTHKIVGIISLLICLISIEGGISAWTVNDISSLRENHQQIQVRLARTRRITQEIRRKEHSLSSHIIQNQQRLEQTQRSLVGQQNHLNYTKGQLDYLGNRLDRVLGETARLSIDAGKRLRNLYTGERLSLLQMILDANDLSSLLDRLYFKQKIVAQDKQLLVNLKSKTQELHQERKNLAVQKEKIATTIVTINTIKSQIATSIDVDKSLRDKYRNDARFYEQAEHQLLAESDSITAQIRAMTSRPRVARGMGVIRGTGVFSMPIYGAITSGFGYRYHPIHRTRMMHTGLDISGPNRGPVHAADGGEVLYAGWRGGYGKVVMINHGERNGRNIVTLYGHLSGTAVSPGQAVSKGQVIGYEGSTGFSTGPHVHFEVRVNGSPVDPTPYVR